MSSSALASPGYTVSYVSQIEAGKRVPSDDALAYFADKLGVSPSYLRTGIPDDLEERLAYSIQAAWSALRSGEVDQAQEKASAAIAEAGRYGLGLLRCRALVMSANALLVSGRTRQAIDRYEEALEGELTDYERGMTVASLAAAYRMVGDLAYAADLVESTLRLRSTPLDPGVSAELHSMLLTIYFERGDITRAERAAARAIDAAREGVSPETRANVLWTASRVAAESNRWEEALQLTRAAREIIEQSDNRQRLARVHVASADLCLEVDPPRLEEAATHLDEAQALLGEEDPPHELVQLYAGRARLALLADRPADALRDSEQALANAPDDPLERGRCLYLRGRALAELGRPDAATEEFREAAATFEKVGARQQVASCYREIGEIAHGRGDTDAAAEAFRRGLEALEPRRSRA